MFPLIRNLNHGDCHNNSVMQKPTVSQIHSYLRNLALNHKNKLITVILSWPMTKFQLHHKL